MDGFYTQDGLKIMIKRLLNAIKEPNKLFLYFAEKGCFDCLNDKIFLRMKYHAKTKKRLNIDIPETFNEKLQWLKLYDRNPEYTVMVDKYLARKYIAEQIGEEYLIPLIGVWDSPNEIDFEALPDRFAVKCNHNSGLGMCICTDKTKLDVNEVRKELEKGLNQNYYLTGREWPYKDVPRKVIAEQFLESDPGGLTDYKIHCFNGVPKFILVCCDRFSQSGLTEDFYTVEWEHMKIKRPDIPNAVNPILKPENLDEMLKLAEKLSENIPFIRIDFYSVNGKVYFSELTFYPASGFEGFEPSEWDKTFGEWLTLPDKQK